VCGAEDLGGELAAASLGHRDAIAVSDAGLPVPTGVERIDLAFAAGQPGFLPVVAAIAEELQVETCVFAEEARKHSPELVEATHALMPGSQVVWVPHDQLKERTRGVVAVVRTGEFTPFANVVLHGGVTFP
jgi:D-ribose pyranase